MRFFVTSLILLATVMVIASCAGKQNINLDEILDADSNGVFVFAETPLLTIDSDMMAREFRHRKLPPYIKNVDSVTAYEAVYEMLLDSILGSKVDEFDLTGMSVDGDNAPRQARPRHNQGNNR